MSGFEAHWRIPLEKGKSAMRLLHNNPNLVLFFLGFDTDDRFVYLSQSECEAFADLVMEHALFLHERILGKTEPLVVMSGHSRLKLERKDADFVRLTMLAGNSGERSALLSKSDCTALADQLRECAKRL